MKHISRNSPFKSDLGARRGLEGSTAHAHRDPQDHEGHGHEKKEWR
jgi:hypothetical protein